MNKKPRLLRFFGVWFLIVSIYIFAVSFSFSLYSIVILSKRSLEMEKKLIANREHLEFALRDYPNNPKFLDLLKRNKEELDRIKAINANYKKLKLSTIDLPFFLFLLLASILYLSASIFVLKHKKLSIKIVPIALLCSLINLFAMPIYKYIKRADIGFPQYGVFMVVALICYTYTFYYFTRPQIKKILIN